jgi:hypothetical protein
VREAVIAGQWMIRQFEIEVETSVSIMLTLAEGKTAEGYFYLAKGNDIDFQISGKSLVYRSLPQDLSSGNVTSDRFAFTSVPAQGIAYSLKLTPEFKEGEKHTAVTVFLELIYPVGGEIYVPYGTK